MKCKCGKIIPDARINALRLAGNLTSTCIECASKNVKRVAGFPLITGKTTYSELQIVLQEQADSLFSQQSRKGQSPGAGIRMKGH